MFNQSYGVYIMPQVIILIALRRTHTHTYTDDPHRINFKKPGLYGSYSPVDLNRLSTHKAVYLTPTNMHTNHLLAHFDCHYCKQVLSRRAVVSREAKKQQACAYSSQCNHYSELFTRMVGLNF